MRSIAVAIPKKKDQLGIYLIYLLLCILLNFLLLDYLLGSNTMFIQTYSNQATGQLPSNIIDVPILSQLPLLPTGCEAASATMLLQWLGLDVSMEEIADALPKGKLPSYENGQLVGANPNIEFIGNPYSEAGFGVYHRPIYEVLNSYIPNKFLDITGCAFDELLTTIDNEQPVMVWATINMSKPSVNSRWQDELGNEVVWEVPEHAMILVGYTNDLAIVNDPLAGKIKYDKVKFKEYWEYMGSQAITVRP